MAIFLAILFAIGVCKSSLKLVGRPWFEVWENRMKQLHRSKWVDGPKLMKGGFSDNFDDALSPS